MFYFLGFLYSCRRSVQANSNSITFRLYVIIISIYAGIHFFLSFLTKLPACHRLTNRCDRWSLVRFIKWMRQVYLLFWTILLCSCYIPFELLGCLLILFIWFFPSFWAIEGTILCWAWHVREYIWLHQVNFDLTRPFFSWFSAWRRIYLFISKCYFR